MLSQGAALKLTLGLIVVFPGMVGFDSVTSGHEELTRCCLLVGPQFVTLDQHENNIGRTPRVIRLSYYKY